MYVFACCGAMRMGYNYYSVVSSSTALSYSHNGVTARTKRCHGWDLSWVYYY